MADPNNSLVVLWTSRDKEAAVNMVFMYTHNSLKFGWWEEVRLVIWGPSGKLLAEDPDLQKEVKEMLDSGIIIEACRACADQLGVSDILRSLGIKVRYMGEPFTQYLKEGKKVITI